MLRVLLRVLLFVSCSFDGGEWKRHYEYAKNELTWQKYLPDVCPEENYLSYPTGYYTYDNVDDKFYSSYADGRTYDRMSESAAIQYATEEACQVYYKHYPWHFKDKIKK